MKVFNGKEAAEQYMSSHTLTFSTPDLTLKRFSFWLGDIVPDPNNKEETMPRLMNYIEFCAVPGRVAGIPPGIIPGVPIPGIKPGDCVPPGAEPPDNLSIAFFNSTITLIDKNSNAEYATT